MCGEVAEEVEKQSGAGIWGGEGGQIISFLRPVERVCGGGILWGDPVCVFRDFCALIYLFRYRFSPKGVGKVDVYLEVFLLVTEKHSLS